MIANTAELTGKALDLAAALALGSSYPIYDTVPCYRVVLNGKDRVISSGWSESQSFNPSSNGKICLEIMEQYFIAPSYDSSMKRWMAMNNEATIVQYGANRREAILRCLVATVLGPTVDIPYPLLA